MHNCPSSLSDREEGISSRRGILRKSSVFIVGDISSHLTKKNSTNQIEHVNDSIDDDFINDDQDLSFINSKDKEVYEDEDVSKDDGISEDVDSNDQEHNEFASGTFDEITETAQPDIPSDLAALKKRIEETVYILTNFSKSRDPNIPRSSYCKSLINDLCLYYGYSEYLINEHFFHMFSVAELIQFLEASDIPRPVTIRTNTLKIKRRRDLAKALISRGINVDPLAISDMAEGDTDGSSSDSWSALGLQVFQDGGSDRSSRGVPLGATPEYLAGLYMLQAAASFLPVIALAPAPGERILDMCAAPGGKSTHCAQLMKNSGLLLANDLSKDRQRATAANIYRLGVCNTIISIMDGRQLPSQFGNNFFDRVLLDAPCSGTGVISKDPSVKVSKEASDFKILTHAQKELILAAIDLTSADNGIIVYSTCSVCVEENEEIVQYALEKRPNVKLVETRLPFGRPGFINYREKRFSPLMKLTMRYYPHVHNLDGFYIAKLVKTSSFPKPTDRTTHDEASTAGEGKGQTQ